MITGSNSTLMDNLTTASNSSTVASTVMSFDSTEAAQALAEVPGMQVTVIVGGTSFAGAGNITTVLQESADNSSWTTLQTCGGAIAYGSLPTQTVVTDQPLQPILATTKYLRFLVTSSGNATAGTMYGFVGTESGLGSADSSGATAEGAAIIAEVAGNGIDR